MSLTCRLSLCISSSLHFLCCFYSVSPLESFVSPFFDSLSCPSIVCCCRPSSPRSLPVSLSLLAAQSSGLRVNCLLGAWSVSELCLFVFFSEKLRLLWRGEEFLHLKIIEEVRLKAALLHVICFCVFVSHIIDKHNILQQVIVIFVVLLSG